MSTETTNAVTKSDARPQVAIGRAGIQITDMDGLVRFSTAVAKSGLAPKGVTTPEAICIAIEMGLEVGLPPMAALQNIAVINGRPSIWGDAMLAVCRSTGEVEEFAEWYEDNGKRLPRNPTTYSDSTVAVCRVKRRGYEAAETGFSVADAKLAKLWGKDGPWSQYPARMLRFRARSFALRDSFGDALKGLRSAEEVSDDPVELAKPATPSAPEFKPRKSKAAKEETANEVVVPFSEPTPAPEAPAQAPEATQEAQQAEADEKPAIDLIERREKFEEFCLSAGITFDALIGWLRAAGRYNGPDLAEFDEIPIKVIEDLGNSPADVRKLVAECGKKK